MTPHLNVCEFYSGIGGYHIALSCIPNLSYTVTAAFEISSNANLFYRHNFPQTNVLETNLCGMTPQKLDSIIRKGVTSPSDSVSSPSDRVTSRDTATMFVLSPPCQPFTRQGCKKDDTDNRSASVLHLFDIFPRLQHIPEYVFLENVQGFESSNTRSIIMEFLTSHDYHVVEFLLNSNSLGIPNSRLRYYLLARRGRLFPDKFRSLGILDHIPDFLVPTPTPPLSDYLEDYNPMQPGCGLTDTFLSKWGWVLDIVTPESTRSCCFTKGYSVKAEGSGSVVQQKPEIDFNDEEKRETNRVITVTSPQLEHPVNEHNTRSMSKSRLSDEDFLTHMKSLDLRYFTPREIARIHGIPDSVTFPPSLSDKQLYKLLGNGLNVTVVRTLIERVLLS